MLQHSFLTRKGGDLLILLSYHMLPPQKPLCKSRPCIPRFPGLNKDSYKALSHRALCIHEMTWHRREHFCSKWVSSMHRPSFSDIKSSAAALLQVVPAITGQYLPGCSTMIILWSCAVDWTGER